MRPGPDRLRECQGVSGVLNKHERQVVFVSQSVRECHGAVVKTVVKSGRLTGGGRTDCGHTERRGVQAEISEKRCRLRSVDGSCPAGTCNARLSCRCRLRGRACLALAPMEAAAERSRYRHDAWECWSFLWIPPKGGGGWFRTGPSRGGGSARRRQSNSRWVRALWDWPRNRHHPDDGLLRLAAPRNRQMVGALNGRTGAGKISQEFTWCVTACQEVSWRVRASQAVSRTTSRRRFDGLPTSKPGDTVQGMVHCSREVQEVAADAGESRMSARAAAAWHGTRNTVPSIAFAAVSAGAGCGYPSKIEGRR